MPFNNSQSAIIDNRRRAVAALRLRGLTVREIEAKLPKLDPPVINEAEDKPWALGTISTDLTALTKEWVELAAADTDELKANILAELREARRAAWDSGRIDLVLKALEDERKLFGLDAPARSDVNLTAQEPVRFVRAVRPEDAE